ncbi:hypothetical protein [Salinicoccus albus]|nr:hypothetical protein [Salinicoccus albus]
MTRRGGAGDDTEISATAESRCIEGAGEPTLRQNPLEWGGDDR